MASSGSALPTTPGFLLIFPNYGGGSGTGLLQASTNSQTWSAIGAGNTATFNFAGDVAPDINTTGFAIFSDSQSALVNGGLRIGRGFLFDGNVYAGGVHPHAQFGVSEHRAAGHLTSARLWMNSRGLSDEAHHERNRGVMAAGAGFLFWGVVPIYWRQMQSVSAIELIAHRIVWSLLFLLGVLWYQKNLGALRPAFADRRAFGRNLLSSVLLAVNWTVYIWAVNSGHVIESSLGYFLVPLANVGLGSVLLHERLRPLQWAAIGLAATGVLVLFFGVGHFPWIALTLAITWSGYGFFKKQSALGAMAGLTVETLMLFPLAAVALLWWNHTGEGALGRVDAGLHALVLSVGVVTAVPLLLFAYGAQRIRLATLGLLQFLAPTVQFLIGLLVYHEAFDAGRFRAYSLIWCGLILYTADSFWAQRHRLRKAS